MLLNEVVELLRIVAVKDEEDVEVEVSEDDEDDELEVGDELDEEDELLVTLELLVVETVDVELRVAK
jgi:hypothetical protein